MPVTPYSPLGARSPPAGEPEVAGMFKKLAARSGASVSVSPAGQSPQEKSGPESWPRASKADAPPSQPPRPSAKLEWAPREEGSMGRYSTCLWYSCCQIGQGEAATFEAWTRQPLTSGMKPLAMGLKTFKEAIAVAQKDADERHARGER